MSDGRFGGFWLRRSGWIFRKCSWWAAERLRLISPRHLSSIVNDDNILHELQYCSDFFFLQTLSDYCKTNECILVVLWLAIYTTINNRILMKSLPLTIVHDLLVFCGYGLPSFRHSILLKVNRRDRENSSGNVKQRRQSTVIPRVSSIMANRRKRCRGHYQCINWSSGPCNVDGLLPSLEPALS